MASRFWPFGVAVLVLPLIASGAASQALDDWDFATDPLQSLAIASVEFEGGASVSVQCLEGQLSMIVGGMPASDAFSRGVSLIREDGRSRRAYLTPVENSMLAKTRDARAIRFLRAGGRMTIASVVGEARPMRMQVDLPARSANIDAVLTTCGYPLADPRDNLTEVSHLIVKYPALQLPQLSVEFVVVTIELSCIISEGRLTACQSDHETPTAPRLGAAMALQANGSDITLQDGAVAEGGLVDIVATATASSRGMRNPRK